MARGTRRPKIHLTAAGWMNDVYGLMYHHGEYHVFFQYLPGSTKWALGCHWGHATSPDLLMWTEQPIALAPGEGDDGCWSGCVVPGQSGATIFYTSVSASNIQLGRIRTARPVDDTWRRWSKSERSPEVPIPSDVEVVAFRDPFVWKDDKSWQMIVGAGLRGGNGAVLSYSSNDLVTWSYDGVLAKSTSAVSAGVVFECPQLFEMNGIPVLVVSVDDQHKPLHSIYATGSYENGRFKPGDWQRLTYGTSYYAASSFTDVEGNRGLVHWIRGAGSAEDDVPWAGAMSVPHTLTLKGGTLVSRPHPNVPRRNSRFTDRRGWPGGTRRLATTTEPCDIAFRPSGMHAPILVKVVHDKQRSPLATVSLVGDVLSVTTPGGIDTMPVPGWHAEVEMIVDNGIIEVFGAKGVLSSTFPPPPDHRVGIDMYAVLGGLERVAVGEIRDNGRPDAAPQALSKES